nr:hypothetical protein CFP56_02598 [Quercus suber]
MHEHELAVLYTDDLATGSFVKTAQALAIDVDIAPDGEEEDEDSLESFECSTPTTMTSSPRPVSVATLEARKRTAQRMARAPKKRKIRPELINDSLTKLVEVLERRTRLLENPSPRAVDHLWTSDLFRGISDGDKLAASEAFDNENVARRFINTPAKDISGGIVQYRRQPARLEEAHPFRLPMGAHCQPPASSIANGQEEDNSGRVFGTARPSAMINGASDSSSLLSSKRVQ